ncbi:MAG: metallophosphoesterase [Roseiarcus sp.]|jgi:hypothetical protein
MEFVHFTDLHYKAGSPFQIEMIRRLLLDLKAARDKGFSPEVLVFSGDLVDNPDDLNIYSLFETNFLRPVLTALHLTKSMVVLCPGNHDISRSAQNSSELAYKSIQEVIGNQEELSRQVKNAEFCEYATHIASGFFALASRYGGAWSNPFYKVYSFGAKKMSFVALNSAFGCSVKGSAADRGKLGLSAEIVLAAFQEIPQANKAISLVHHTFGDMAESTVRRLVPIVENHAIAHCFGHVHDPKPTTSKSPSGSCFHIQGGALYERLGAYNGYAVIKIADHGEFIEARYRSYYVDRNDFDEGTNISRGGKIYNSPASERYWTHLVPPPSQNDVCYFLHETEEAVCSVLNETITGHKLNDTFIEPRVVRPAQMGEMAENVSEVPYQFSHLLTSDDHVVIGAENEFGATSLLRYLTMQFHRQCAELPTAKVPALIDARRFRARPYEASMANILRSALPDSQNPSLRLQSLHDSGRLVVLIDDFDPADKFHVASLAFLSTRYRKARLIVSAKIPLLPGDYVLPVVGIDEFLFLQIKPLNRGRVRRLVANSSVPVGLSIDQVVEEIISRFRALGIPLTATYVAIYLSILTHDRGFSPINTSTVIENFIDDVLDKYKPEYRFRTSFDYRAQVAYLSDIAERMCRTNIFAVEFEVLYGWTKAHFEFMGIIQDYQSVIRFFIDNKVFDIVGNTIFFRYRIFLSFFIASQMVYSTSFKEWILSNQNYLRYVNELDLYCGINRNDLGILDFLGGEFKLCAAKLAEMVAPLAWTDHLDGLKLPPIDKNEFDLTGQITRQLTRPNLPGEERDELLDGPEGEQSVKPLVTRREVQDVIEVWIMSLRAYTVALKNLEGIQGTKKEEHLREIFEGWATVLRYACLLFDSLIQDKELSVGNMQFTLAFPEKMENRFARTILVNLPLVVSQFLRGDLGSQKLAAQLKNDSIAISTAAAFLQTGLYADMKLPEYIGQLKRLIKKIGKSQFFREALLVKLRDIYLRYDIGPVEQKGFREVVAALSADLGGFTGQARADHIRKSLEDLRKTRLVKRVRDER